MFQLHSITDFDDPRLKPFRTLRAQMDHLHRECFVAEGEKVVRRMLESPCEVVSVLMPPKWVSTYEPLLAARPEPIDLFVAEREILEKLTGFSLFQGVLGLSRVPSASSLDHLRNLTAPALLAAVDGLTSAENVGTVVRNLVALGGQGLVVGETSAHPYLRRAVRSSMGTIFKLPYLISPCLVDTLVELRRFGVRCVAAHPHVDQRWLWDVDLTQPTCVVLGAEGEGLRPEVLAACDEAAAIPMSQTVDSLNVANAAAVFLAEALRQRRVRVEGSMH